MAGRRVVARVPRRGEELRRVEAPELRHLGEGGDDRVHQAAVPALDLAHVDVEDRLAVLVDADRADRAALQPYFVQGAHEGRLVLEAALDRVEGRLEVHAGDLSPGGVEPWTP